MADGRINFNQNINFRNLNLKPKKVQRLTVENVQWKITSLPDDDDDYDKEDNDIYYFSS